MTIRNHTAIAALLATLSACTPIPAHADAFPPGATFSAPAGGIEKLAPDDPLGYQPATFPKIPGGVSSYRVFDPPIVAGRLAAPVQWNGAPQGFVIPVTALSRWNGTPPPPPDLPPVMEPPRPPKPPKPEPPQADVPGPLGLAGVAAAFGWARRLRRRVG